MRLLFHDLTKRAQEKRDDAEPRRVATYTIGLRQLRLGHLLGTQREYVDAGFTRPSGCNARKQQPESRSSVWTYLECFGELGERLLVLLCQRGAVLSRRSQLQLRKS